MFDHVYTRAFKPAGGELLYRAAAKSVTLRDVVTMSELTNPQIRKLKALAQRLEPALKVGKNGITDAFIQSTSEALTKHELVKIKFVDFKEEKKELSATLAEKTHSEAIMRVGHVVVLYRQNAEPEKQVIKF